MFSKLSIKVQFIILVCAAIGCWSLFCDLYWNVLEKVVYSKTIDETTVSDRVYILTSVIILTVITMPIFALLVHTINSPVRKIIEGIKKLAKGDYSTKISVKGGKEFIEIAEAFNSMSEELLKMQKLKADIEKERVMLFASLAHDIKTPLTSIMGYSKALCDGMIEDEKKEKVYLETMSEKAERINTLVDRLFEYVKLESPENVLHKSSCDIAEILRNAIAELYTDFEEKEIELCLEITEEKIIKEVDPLEINRVFTNLLNNALKHNKRRTLISVIMDKEGKIIIADKGEKISKEMEEKLFKPFASGDESRMSKNGSGLGLALSKKIMEKHEGNLSYLSHYKDFSKAFLIEFK